MRADIAHEPAEDAIEFDEAQLAAEGAHRGLILCGAAQPAHELLDERHEPDHHSFIDARNGPIGPSGESMKGSAKRRTIKAYTPHGSFLEPPPLGGAIVGLEARRRQAARLRLQRRRADAKRRIETDHTKGGKLNGSN